MTADRFVRLEGKFPGIINLAVSVKRIPSDYTADSHKTSLSLKNVLTEELRQVTCNYENGKIPENYVHAFIAKANTRMQKARKINDDRKIISEMVSESNFIDLRSKTIILRLLSIKK